MNSHSLPSYSGAFLPSRRKCLHQGHVPEHNSAIKKMSETKEGNEMKSFLKVTAMILVITATMFASNPNGATATNTVSGSVALQVSVNTAVRLSFAAGTTAVNGGAACVLGGSVVVGSASDVSFNLGTVDGLGLSAPTFGGLVSEVGVGGTSAT